MKKKPLVSLSSVTFALKPYTLKQLADLYGITPKTFRKWLAPFVKKVGNKQGYFYNISQVQCIVESLGVPGNAVVD